MLRRLLAAVSVAALVAVTGPLAAPAHAAVTSVPLVGHGWGHGIGMGQYGAQGYGSGWATGTAWTSAQILNHFYGGTTAATVAAGSNMTVVLNNPAGTAWQGYTVATVVQVTNAANRPLVQVGAGTPTVATGNAVRVLRTGATTFDIQYGTSCAAGDWGPPTPVTATTVDLLPQNPSDTLDGSLQVCDGVMAGTAVGNRRYVRGSVQARSTSTRQYTLNIVPLESYLRSVVPRESPASWSAPALQAQTVAARSFAVRDAANKTASYGFAATCDTTSCQVYGGRRWVNGASTYDEHPNTDAAVAATANVVRHTAGGAIALTQFSSSTGGWTVGGDYTAVQDLGDAIPSNPNHTWNVTLQATTIAAAYSRSAANFQGLTVTGNGLGADGGRATQVVIHFTDGDLTRTGNQFRQTFGLKSDWFTVQVTADQATRNYVDRLFRDFLGRPPTTGELDSWSADLYSGRISRLGLTQVLATSDEWAGAVVTRLYWDTLGRGPDGPGLAGWVQALRNGARVPDVAAGFYASAEFYARSGSTPEGFVRELYRLILERQPDQAGLNAWTAASTTLAGRLNTAKGFFGSIESRRKRVTALYWSLLGRAPDQAGLNGWAEVLQTRDDIVLAATLATSNEYFSRAQTLAG